MLLLVSSESLNDSLLKKAQAQERQQHLLQQQAVSWTVFGYCLKVNVSLEQQLKQLDRPLRRLVY